MPSMTNNASTAMGASISTAAAANAALAKSALLERVLPDCYLYISHLEEPYQYWMLPGYPDELTDQMDSRFDAVSALGRSAPVYTFSSAGPRTIQLTFRFHRDMFEEINQCLYPNGSDYFTDADDMAERFIHALQAVAVPKYNLANKALEPPLVAVRLGREVFIKGVITSGISVHYRKPILVNEKYAEVEISFTIAEVDPYDSSTVFQNGSFRGMMASLRKGLHF